MLLRQLLYRTELRFLPIIASYWLRINSKPNYEELIRLLCVRMLDKETLKQFLNSPVGKELTPVLNRLIHKGGIEPTESFEETAGAFRIVGMDKLLREKYWQNPVSITEKLWYRGFIYRENRFINNEPIDCYLMPEDLCDHLSDLIPENTPQEIYHQLFTVRPAIPSETKSVNTINNVLPDFFSITAALIRDKREIVFPSAEISPSYINFLKTLASEAFFQYPENEETADAIRNFLIQNRTSAKIQLLTLWRNSESYDELSESGEIKITNPPQFDKKKPRETILNFIKDLPSDTWLSINGFISAVKKRDPLFLRRHLPESCVQMYDLDDNDLSGLGSWYQLEGSYLRFYLTGPMQWIGLIQIAYTDKTQKEASAFRIIQDTSFFISESSDNHISEGIRSKPNLETANPVISADGAISCSTNVPRYFRYMAVRYCEIDNIKSSCDLTLRITPSSLTKAENNGLTRTSFLSLLKRFSGAKLPQSLIRMLESTNQNALPATIYQATILTVPDKDVLAELMETHRLERWIMQQINPTSLLIDPKGIAEIRRFLMEREIFVDIQV